MWDKGFRLLHSVGKDAKCSPQSNVLSRQKSINRHFRDMLKCANIIELAFNEPPLPTMQSTSKRNTPLRKRRNYCIVGFNC